MVVIGVAYDGFVTYDTPLAAAAAAAGLTVTMPS